MRVPPPGSSTNLFIQLQKTPPPAGREPIRIGIIGTGLAAEHFHLPVIKRLESRFTIVAFSNRTRKTAEEFAGRGGLAMKDYYADYRDLLARDDVEAVLLLVPIGSIFSIAADVLKAGKHLISEKPPGGNEEEGKGFLKLVANRPRQKVLMTEQFFYRDDLRLARALIAQGAIGIPKLITVRVFKHEVSRPGSFSSTPWRHNPTYRGGSILDGGVHEVAGMRMLGGDAESLFAQSEELNTVMQGPSVLNLSIRFADGISGDLLYLSTSSPSVDESSDMRVYGTEGSVIISHARLKLVQPEGEIGGRVQTFEFEDSKSFYNAYLNFFDAVTAEDEIVATVAQSLKNMMIVMRGLDSAEQGKSITVAGEDWNRPANGIPLWMPKGAEGLFDGLPVTIRMSESLIS